MRKRIIAWITAAVLLLSAFPCAAAADNRTKLVALTFDDGPCDFTEALLDGLVERGVKATFFVQGIRAEKKPELIRRMLLEGHQVGNHSYDHPNLSQIPLKEAAEQLTKTNAILDEITGGRGGYAYRAPYGASTGTLRVKMDAPFFKWSADTLDWSSKNVWSIRSRLLTTLHDGDIVLSHDTVEQTTEATLMAIDRLQKQGYEFVTINELYYRRGLDAMSGCEDQYCCPFLSEQKEALTRPVISAEPQGDRVRVTLECDSGVPMYYTVDGTPVLFNGTAYRGSFTVTAPCTIRAVAAWDLNGCRSEETVLSLSAEDTLHGLKTQIADDTYLTRGLLAQLLYEQQEHHYVQPCTQFVDVPEEHPQAAGISWAYASGVFDGTGKDHFEPDLQVSREEVAKVLASWLKLDAADEMPDFRDSQRISGWARDSVSAVVEAGLLQGDTNHRFNPTKTMTGAEIKVILERMEHLN